ncbi:YfiR family protein [Fulvivirga sediminis]|uniref:YfiR family protein n=1 Tax=Fulvivirga sediminis TaxID=2803949 RepID=A0A937F952_9BACT|nr:YfiR family protein [Fulvivirga sediminis]MBL3656550.1 YfiR family protein [Fulvivirga sediminis]
MKILKSTTLLTAFMLVAFFGTTRAQGRPIHEIHSMMIYNFIKYIQWPSSDQSQNFVIAVIGDDEVYNTLNTWYGGKLRGNKKFVVKKFNSPSEISSCHILYVAKGSSKDFDEIRGKLSNSSTLIITDKPGLGQKGSGINFRTVNNKLAFELNQKVIEQSQLKVSGQLSSMAILI